MKLLLYCTKAKPYLIQGLAKPMHTLDVTNPFNFNWKLVNKGFSNDRLNGKIVAECDFEVEEISRIKSWNSTEDYDWEYETPTLYYYDLLRKSCLMCDEFEEYIEFNGYAIHIKNLHIFDEPRELLNISKAPQNMMKYLDENDNLYILISIRPEWLCKILNGEKTIEVRKKVLREMLK